MDLTVLAAVRRTGWKNFFESMKALGDGGLESLADADYRPEGDIEEFMELHRHLLGIAGPS
jgi:hypothetical protein